MSKKLESERYDRELTDRYKIKKKCSFWEKPLGPYLYCYSFPFQKSWIVSIIFHFKGTSVFPELTSQNFKLKNP